MTFRLDFDEQTWASNAKHEGDEWQKSFRQIYGMLLTEFNWSSEMGHLNMKCKKSFDLWWRDDHTDSNIGSNGDGSSLEVPIMVDLWKS